MDGLIRGDERAIPAYPLNLLAVAHNCVQCDKPFKGEARAVLTRRPTLLRENEPGVWRLSRAVPSVVFRLCRRKNCASFLQDPVLPAQEGVDFEDSIFHRNTMRFLEGPISERPWPVRPQTFFSEARSAQMQPFLRDERSLLDFCDRVDTDGLRCVGCWSRQSDIDAVYHYARLFAQEAAKDSGVWMPYWFRDARLIGPNRVAYLIKGSQSYLGAVMMDTLQYQTLAWVWLTPRFRRREIFLSIWRKLESYHPDFKVLAPLSTAMLAFLNRHDAAGHEVVTETGAS